MTRLIIIFSLFIAIIHNSLYGQNIPSLNLESAIDHSGTFKFKDFIKSIEYIPLETNPGCLIDKNPKFFVTRDYIISLNVNHCFLFDRASGKFIREIGRYGRGPGEYQNAIGFVNDNIPAIYFVGWNGNLLKYSVNGNLIKNFQIPGYKDNFDLPSIPMNYTFYNDSIIVCDFLIATGREPNLIMVFNESGQILKFIKNRNLVNVKKDFVLQTGETSFFHFNEKLFFQNKYNDTVFQISPENLVPFFILNRGKYKPPFESKWWSYGKVLQSNFISQLQYSINERFILFSFLMNKTRYFALYNRTSRSLKVASCSTIENNIDGIKTFNLESMNYCGELIGVIQANDLTDWENGYQSKSDLKNPNLQKLANVRMDDNPVIVIAELK
jgi:hypothetical protein